MKYSWLNRAVPPLTIGVVAGCVWYALRNRPAPVAPTISASLPVTHANAESIAPASPQVQKQGSDVQFTVPAVPYKDVQRVEFYVEDKFVGVAYSQPYTVTVSENTLVAGTHQVSAKIVTSNTTVRSPSADFVAQPTSPPTTIPDNDAPSIPPPTVASGIPSTPTPAAPADLTATAGSDGTSAALSWAASPGAAHYQIWRNNSQIASVTGTGYTDTDLSPGYTYDYQIITVDAAGNTSQPSDTLAITMPTPVSSDPGNDDVSSQQSQNTSSANTTN